MTDNYGNFPAFSEPRDPWKIKAVGDLPPDQNVPEATAAMQALCQKTGKELVSFISNIQVQSNNFLAGAVLPCSNLGYFPVCREQFRSPFYLPFSLQDVLGRLQWDYSFDDDAWIKAVLVKNLVEIHLMIMTQHPRERARFFTVDLAIEAIRKISNIAQSRRLFPAEFTLLKLLQEVPEIRERLSYDQLFNTDIFSNALLLQLNDDLASVLRFDINSLLGLSTEHYPFLHFATHADMMSTDSISMTQKAYSMAEKIGINAAESFKEFLRLEKFPYNQKYALSTANFQLPAHLTRVDIRGEQCGIKQTLL
ncbi:MAG: hypothetical protein WCT05_16410, partial [Lentisphaeria bacterium]